MSILLETLRDGTIQGDQNDATFASEVFSYGVPPATYGSTGYHQSGLINDGSPGIGTIDYLIFYVRRRVRDSLDPSTYTAGTIRWFENPASPTMGSAAASAAPPLGTTWGDSNSGQITTKPTGGAWTWAAVNDLTSVGANIDWGSDAGPVTVFSFYEMGEMWVEVWGTLGGDILEGRTRGRRYFRAPRRSGSRIVGGAVAEIPFREPMIPVWPIPANGGEPIVEGYGFLTDVIESYNKKEQRIGLRAVPLETLDFGILETSSAAQIAATNVLAYQNAVIGIPLWQYGTRSTGAIAVGATLLPIGDAADVPYRVGGLVLAWRDPISYELFTVQGTSGAGVATVELATRSWGVGEVLIFPVRRSRIGDKVQLVRESSSLLTGRVRFTMEQDGIV